MSTELNPGRYRLLVIDDNRAIHNDFKKILTPDMELQQLDQIEADLFGKTIEAPSRQDFDIDSAYQGEEGLACVQQSLAEGRPYSLAFIDMRMPPGWNGIETIEQIWSVDPLLQVVICSAYSDHSWAEISQRLGNNDRLLILKKPFDNVEILQMAYAMSNKCELARKQGSAGNVHKLDAIQRTIDGELIGPIEDIKESVNLLQRSFEQLNGQLKQLRNVFNENTALLSDQRVQELLGSADLPELEQRIPKTFSRLLSALAEVSLEQKKTTGRSKKPMH